jgi:hypothetical protein
MAAKDVSFSFNFWSTYNKIETVKLLEITLGDSRKTSFAFESNEAATIYKYVSNYFLVFPLLMNRC